MTFHEIEFATNVPSVLFLESDYLWHFITDVIVYTYAEFEKQIKILHIVPHFVGSLLQYSILDTAALRQLNNNLKERMISK